jgi:hypothetical protein
VIGLAGLLLDGERAGVDLDEAARVGCPDLEVDRLCRSPDRLVASGRCDVVLEAFEARVGAEAEADLFVGDQVSLGVAG